MSKVIENISLLKFLIKFYQKVYSNAFELKLVSIFADAKDCNAHRFEECISKAFDYKPTVPKNQLNVQVKTV